MSEKCLTEVTYEEHPGFSNALFFNMTDYDCTTPIRDISDSVENSRLSIESLTPGTTPKGTEKRKNDSNFKFCLSQDLLQRLEANSPFNASRERKENVTDIFLSGGDEACEEDDNFEKDYELKNFPTPSTVENSNLYSSHYDRKGELFSYDGVNKKLNFNKENEKGIMHSKGATNTNFSFNSFNSGANLGVFSSFGKSVSNVYNVNQQYFINSESNSNGNNSNTTSGVKAKDFNKFNNIPFCFNGSHSDGKNVTKNIINAINNSQAQGRENMGTMGTMNIINNGPLGNIGNMNGVNSSINMYGKNGWICLFCKNFNYEVRVKCNRCSKSRSELCSGVNVPVSGCNSASKSAVIINHNLTSMLNKSGSDSPTSNNQSTINLVGSSSSTCSANLACKETAASTAKKKKPFVERFGDWNCYKCKNLNFSFRVNCNRCQLSKKESEKLSDQYMKNILFLTEESSPDN